MFRMGTAEAVWRSVRLNGSHRGQRGTVIAGTAIAAMALAACGASSATAKVGSAQGHKKTGSGNVGTASSGGTLTLFEPSPPSSLNPAQNQGPVDAPVVDLAYGNLFHQVSPTDYQPEMGQSFRYVGKGNREIQIVLRPNIKFPDGTRLTSKLEAEVIRYSIKAGGLGPSQFPLKTIKTPNSRTLDVYFTQAFPFAEAEFSQQGGVGSPISPAGMKTKAIGYKTFGAGPYQLDNAETTAGSVYTFVKNPTYFDPSQQKWSKVVLKVIGNENSAVQAAATTGSSYVAGDILENATAKAAGLKIAPVAQTKSYGLLIADRLGKLVPALGSVKVRQALNYAVNRSQGAKALGGSPLEQLNEAGFPGHYSKNIYSYNVTKAKSLLKAAGYPNGFTFTALVNGTDGTSVQAAQLLVSDFQKIGVTMKLVTAPTENAFVGDLAAKKYAADVDQLPGNVLSFVQATLFPGGFWNFFDDPLPSKTFMAQYKAASADSGATATAAWAGLMRNVQQNYVWLAEIAAVAPSYYSTKDVGVPLTYGVTPDPVYFTKS